MSLLRAALVALWAAAPALAVDVSAPVPPLPEPPAAMAAGVPSSLAVMERARALDVAPAQIAQAIEASADVVQAARALESLQLLRPGEVDASRPADAMAMRHVLQALWAESSPHLPPDAAVDAAWPVAALVVPTPTASFYVHGVSHGLTGAIDRRPARKLARTVERLGAPLVVEQDLPAAYRLRYGEEVVDRPHQRLAQGGLASAVRLLPLGRRSHAAWFHFLGWLSTRAGNVDLAAHFHRVAETVFSSRPCLEDLRRLELPAALRASLEPEVAERSRALASAALAAAGRGAQEVHILAGLAHVREIAELLRGAGAQPVGASRAQPEVPRDLGRMTP